MGAPCRSWKAGSTRQWRRTREFVLRRDGYRCQLQLPGCTGTATHVHHTVGRGTTGDDPRYLVGACEHCNLSLGDPTKHDPPAQPRTRWLT